jgi:hypothetical protein
LLKMFVGTATFKSPSLKRIIVCERSIFINVVMLSMLDTVNADKYWECDDDCVSKCQWEIALNVVSCYGLFASRLA